MDYWDHRWHPSGWGCPVGCCCPLSYSLEVGRLFRVPSFRIPMCPQRPFLPHQHSTWCPRGISSWTAVTVGWETWPQAPASSHPHTAKNYWEGHILNKALGAWSMNASIIQVKLKPFLGMPLVVLALPCLQAKLFLMHLVAILLRLAELPSPGTSDFMASFSRASCQLCT